MILTTDCEKESGQHTTCTLDSKSSQGGGHSSDTASHDEHTLSAPRTSSAHAAPEMNALGVGSGVTQATRSKAKATKSTKAKKEEENEGEDEEGLSISKYRPMRQRRSALKQEPDSLEDDMTFQKIEGFLG